MAYDAEFTEGFDKYGPAGTVNPSTLMTAGEWTGAAPSGFATTALVAALSGTGAAVTLTAGSGAYFGYSKTLPGNYARVIGGAAVRYSPNGNPAGITFRDGATAQFSITVNCATGTLSVKRGEVDGTVLGTSTQSFSTATVAQLEWDITCHNTGGLAKVWLDGVLTSVNLSGVLNTRVTANNYVNAVSMIVTNGGNLTYDHMYIWMFTASGGAETPALTNPVVVTQWGTADDTADFTVMTGVLGDAYRATTTINAPGANQIVLRKFTPQANCTINSVSFLPQTTTATGKFKAVIYGDTAGAPGALLSSGTEVVGVTTGVLFTGNLVTPQALAGGTQYWIGFILDTNINLSQVADTTLAYKAANTYTSGAPGAAPAMTIGQVTWMIYGNVTAFASHFPILDENPPLGDLSYVASATVGHKDLFTFPALPFVPSVIYTAAIKGYMARSDAGARTVNLLTKSGGTTGSGSLAGQAPPAATYNFKSSYFKVDPNTGAAWAYADLNAAKHGYEIAS